MPHPLGMFTKVGRGRDGVVHNKFWECLSTRDGDFRVRWGPIGSPGRTQRVPASVAQYRIQGKMRDGYVHDPFSPGTLEEVEAAALEAALPCAPAPAAGRVRL